MNKQLSTRELQVLKLVGQGKLNKEIAWELGIARRTVETFRARIMLKMDLHGHAALVRFSVSYAESTWDVLMLQRLLLRLGEMQAELRTMTDAILRLSANRTAS